jgi:hypothetical protein
MPGRIIGAKKDYSTVKKLIILILIFSDLH